MTCRWRVSTRPSRTTSTTARKSTGRCEKTRRSWMSSAERRRQSSNGSSRSNCLINGCATACLQAVSAFVPSTACLQAVAHVNSTGAAYLPGRELVVSIMRRMACLLMTTLAMAASGDVAPNPQPGDSKNGLWAEFRVLDAGTGRGVPLVELETVNHLKFVTDNAGRVAFHEPGLMDREIFFTVRSHGYELKKDGFGFAGVRITPRAGQASEVKITRHNVAERLCRLTGEGLYRDTILLGHAVPLADVPNPGLVAGQDTVQAAVYNGRVYWFWGDTNRMSYPLGLFRVAGATTPLPADAFDPADGIPFNYFVDPKTGFARAMMPLPERPEGVVWVESVFVVADEGAAEKLVGHYSRRKGLAEEYEQGIAVFDDARAVFEPAKDLPFAEKWRRPNGHPILYDEGGTRWLLFGSPTPNVRVPARLRDVL